ncbi:BFD-like 2Fe-2S binding domain protein [Tepidimonas alkaliphilus]|uniref:BFD-like 2Fe-2S binding domain protein n=1 Tax=Tepidimonas alkaliphilus TaxID=2588942 RepID=A0A554W7C1_9BURK|nr:BFD-like 2Fe-2S binding domain protein [Tepidimonas alkaliphilus]
MIVCVCHRVSDREFQAFARQGRTFEALQLERGVATGCGRCEPCARALWQTLTDARNGPSAPLTVCPADAAACLDVAPLSA